MDMRIVHADQDLTEIGYVAGLVKFDAQITRNGDVAGNSFMMEIPDSRWSDDPVTKGHYLYIDGTEWGGIVDAVKHSTKERTVWLSGPLWRGLLLERVLEPDSGSAYRTIAPVNANEFIRAVIGSAFGDMFAVPHEDFSVSAGGQFRYPTMLGAIETAFAVAGIQGWACGRI